nr:TPA: VP1 [Baja California bark scorpion polyomavirus 1]
MPAQKRGCCLNCTSGKKCKATKKTTKGRRKTFHTPPVASCGNFFVCDRDGNNCSRIAKGRYVRRRRGRGGPVQWTVFGNRMCNYEILKPDNNPCHRIYCLTYIQAGGDSRIRIKKLTIQHPDDYWCSPSSCNKPKNFKGNKCTETSNKMLRWEIFAANVEQRWVVQDNVTLHQPFYHTWAIGNSELVLAEYDTAETKRGQINGFVVESNPGEYDWTDPEDRGFYIYQQNQFMTETAYPTLMQNAPPPGETSLSNAYQIVTDEDKIGIILFKPEITLGHAHYCSGGTPSMNVKFKLYMRPRLICVQPLLTMLLANQGAMTDLPPIPTFDHVVPVKRGLKKYPDNPPPKPATPCVIVCQNMCDFIADCLDKSQFTKNNTIKIKDEYLSDFVRNLFDSSDFTIGREKIAIDPNYVPALVCAALNNPDSNLYNCLDSKLPLMPFMCSAFKDDTNPNARCLELTINKWMNNAKGVLRESMEQVASNAVGKNFADTNYNYVNIQWVHFFERELEKEGSGVQKAFKNELVRLIKNDADVQEAIRQVKLLGPIRPFYLPIKEQEMEVDREKQKNILEVIGETTQSDTVPRPISPSEVPNGPSVDPCTETRGNDDEEDDIDGLLTFDKIYFAYNIYTDMFKEPDSLESFTNYIRRNAKLDRVAEKMVDAYKNKKKLK